MDEWVRWGLGLIAAGIATVLGWFAVGRITRIEEDLKEVRSDMDTYKENCGIGKAALEAIDEKLSAHIDREENILWSEIRADRKRNEEAHAALLSGIRDVSERVVAVETLITNRLPLPRKRK